jgi:hypothetical protein
MIFAEQSFVDCINSPRRNVEGRVELYEGSTLIQVFKSSDHLQSFKVERIGEEGKFFGFGICQKLTVKLVDKDRTINITPKHSFEAVFGTQYDYVYTNPVFYVEDIQRDENTNELTITAYDALYRAPKYTVSDLGLVEPYSIEMLATACASLLGLSLKIVGIPEADKCFSTVYPGGANFEGKETIRQVLNAIAEATQTIYFIDYNWDLTFKRLDHLGEAVITIPKTRYFTLKDETSKTIVGITHTTELGDSVSSSTAGEGVIQFVRDNPLWDLREDIGDLVQQAADNITGLTICQFDLSWRGNYLVELGDKIDIVNKNNGILTSYVLNDTIVYDGGLKQTNKWSYADKEMETASNPANLGAALNQTFARVDKANKRIDIVASEVAENHEAISSLQINTESISASVSNISNQVSEAIEGVNGNIETLSKKVEAQITAEDVSIAIKSELDNGVDKVITNTGFTFDDVGLTVSKSNSEMETTITEDGMTVYKNNETVLTANNEGVKAVDLHATTYLIIGTNSRFENYGSNRTACFWIGQGG